MKLSKLFNEFFHSEKSAGIVLIGCTVISLTLANSALAEEYTTFWSFTIADHNITHWVNDALMAIFFLLIGLELEREVYVGELSDIKKSALPLIGALGGMLIPAAIHFALNASTPYQGGAGIPMATDIAFALAILSLLGNRVPPVLKVFLTALAVIDDLGAIIIIAIFYTGSIQWYNLIASLGIFGLLLLLNRLRIHNLIPYLLGGLLMWYFMLHSGVHATITGVLLAFAIPFGDGSEKSPSYKLQQNLHIAVAFVVLPLFALANTNIPISANAFQTLLDSNSIGIILGLLVGKPLGILAFCFFGVKAKLAKLPDGVSYSKLLPVTILAGIGFTMSIFITLLAFNDPIIIVASKIAIMVASILAGIIGYILLRISLNSEHETA